VLTKEDMQKILGGLISGLTDAGLESLWASNPEYWSGKFPFIAIHEDLPPVDDLVVGVVGPALTFAGQKTRNRTVETLGKGGTSYTVGMLIETIVDRQFW